MIKRNTYLALDANEEIIGFVAAMNPVDAARWFRREGIKFQIVVDARDYSRGA